MKKTINVKRVPFTRKKIEDKLSTLNLKIDFVDTAVKWIQNQENERFKNLFARYEEIIDEFRAIVKDYFHQVSKNKILKNHNSILLRELRYYVPDHRFFEQEDDQQEEENKQQKFDFSNVENIDDHK